jgi:protocatechuate 3,4-dioxygenase alpha subunit
VLTSVPEERRHTLVVTEDEHGYVFDIRLQGADETVFLEFGGA